ncbi:MAG: DUF1573 domain-containing protein [Betaproteobacteria bacterium]|nr:DUF1573 domain-containing protein [Betaproteobacteria bacterium]
MWKNKIALAAGLFVLAVVMVIVFGIPKPEAKAPATVEKIESPRSSGALAARESKFDFGSISMAAGKVTHNYWIRNTGATPIVITKLYTSCMCTTAALVKAGRKFDPYGMPGHGYIPALNEPLAPNEDAMIEIVFDPAAHGPAGVGPIERVVTIENNAAPPLELALSAVVTP